MTIPVVLGILAAIAIYAGIKGYSVTGLIFGQKQLRTPPGPISPDSYANSSGSSTSGVGGKTTGGSTTTKSGDYGKIIGTPYQGTHKPGATTPASWQSDNAYDYSLPVGTPIVSVINGTVEKVFRSAGQYTAGYQVTIRASNGTLETFMAHLSNVIVHQGQSVRSGQMIGSSGEANGVAHLHFAVNTPYDPKAFGYKAFPAK